MRCHSQGPASRCPVLLAFLLALPPAAAVRQQLGSAEIGALGTESHGNETLASASGALSIWEETLPLSVTESVEFTVAVGTPPCAHTEVFRQNKSLALTADCKRAFTGDDLHRSYVAKNPAAETSFYFKTSSMCGAGLFTRPKLDCSLTTAEDIQPSLALLQGMSMPQRGFGVELELVARDTSQWSRNKSFAGTFAYWGWEHARAKAVAYGLGSADGRVARQRALLPGAKYCYKEKTFDDGRRKYSNCKSHSDCHLADFCRKPHNTTFSTYNEPYCKSRVGCRREKSIDGECAVPLQIWDWTTDVSVKPLTQSEAILGGAADPVDEATGLGFELISPGPPNVLADARGLRSVAETLSILERLGIQAGPSSGMHVHVNVGRPGRARRAWWDTEAGRIYDEPGRLGGDLKPSQILNVWAHYARFQHVINEMLQDSRIGNSYAYPLLFSSSATINIDRGYASITENVTKGVAQRFHLAGLAVRDTYARLMSWVKKRGDDVDASFCNSVSTHLYDEDAPCSKRYPKARYFQVNLIPMDRIGTIEFRGFPSTSDPERALRWVHFIVNFVEHYKDDRRFIDWELARGGDSSVDFTPIMDAQRNASLNDLAEELSMDAAWVDYWQRRDWLNANICFGDASRPMPDEEDDDTEESEIQAGLEAGQFDPVTIDGGAGEGAEDDDE